MNGTGKWAMAASMAAVLGVQAMGQQVAAVQTTGIQTAPVTNRVIVVSLEDRKLALVEDGQVKKVYTVAVGKPTAHRARREHSRSRGGSRTQPIRTMAKPFCRGRGIRWALGGWD